MPASSSLIRRCAGLFAAGAAVIATAAGAAAAGPGGTVPQGFVGAVVDGPLYPQPARGVTLSSQFDAMVASGVQSVKAVIDWAYAQPYASFAHVPAAQRAQFTDVGGIPTRFSEIDPLVAAAAAHGMTVLPTVMYAPSWDAAPAPKPSFPIPRSDAPYASFLTALVTRYGPHGSFWASVRRKVPIRTWEIWNEPDITKFWSVQPFAPSYVQLLHAAHDAIKHADPGATLVLAGLTNFSWQDLAAIYAIPGASGWFDAVAAHPYTKQPAGVITILGKLRAVMNEHGDSSKPLIADEISWPSAVGQSRLSHQYDFTTTQAGQASRIAQLIPMLASHRRSLNLLGFDYYTWATAERRNLQSFDYAGLERYAGGGRFFAKPALAAYRTAVLALEGCSRKGPLATNCLH
ncbi:MAG: glycoside hydrolase 5 family protein [Solirubrobacteraceae bacterium]